jgi:hypothetical protein
VATPPPTPLTPHHRHLTVLEELDGITFFFNYLLPNKPLLLGANATSSWPAHAAWVHPNGSVNLAGLQTQYGKTTVVPLSHCLPPTASQLNLPDEIPLQEYAAYLHQQRRRQAKVQQPPPNSTVPLSSSSSPPSMLWPAGGAPAALELPPTPAPPPPPPPLTAAPAATPHSLLPYQHPMYLKDWHACLLDEVANRESSTAVPATFNLAGDWLNEYCRYRKSCDTDDFRFVYLGPAGSSTLLHTDVRCL